MPIWSFRLSPITNPGYRCDCYPGFELHQMNHCKGMQRLGEELYFTRFSSLKLCLLRLTRNVLLENKLSRVDLH